MKKIKITSKQYRALSFAYRIGGFIVIVGLLIGYATLIGKLTEFICVFLPYFITKGFYARQWHASSLKQCFMLSLIIFGFLTTIALPKEYSISVAIVLGLSSAYASYRAGVIQFKLKDYEYIEPIFNKLTAAKPFHTDTCTESELVDRCRELGFSDDNTRLAVLFFIKKLKHSEIAAMYSIEEDSAIKSKYRMKKLLNKADK